MEGNQRFVQEKLEHPNRHKELRERLVSEQKPFAIIVGCADSRVPPEIIFDQGVGDLFVVRVAGNVIGPVELDSIEFAALHLNASTILVLGHQNCGAVHAVIQGAAGDIAAVADLIAPAVKKAKEEDPSNLLVDATQENALRMADLLKETPSLKKLVDEKKIEVHAGYFHLPSGKVELLNERD